MTNEDTYTPVHVELTMSIALIHCIICEYRGYSSDVTIEIRPFISTSQLKYVHLFPDNAVILGGKKMARFYTISEMQAATCRNLYFEYVN